VASSAMPIAAWASSTVPAAAAPRKAGAAFVIPADHVWWPFGQTLDLHKLGQQRANWSRGTRPSSTSIRSPARPRRSGSSPAATAVSGPSSVVEPWRRERAARGHGSLSDRSEPRLLARGARSRHGFGPGRRAVRCGARETELDPRRAGGGTISAEVEQPWLEPVAVRQARRCLRCDYGKRGLVEITNLAGHKVKKKGSIHHGGTENTEKQSREPQMSTDTHR